ncbi:hypothetical protein [Burkholderia cepacia]|uniref:hypothetical protein n=1 Tax=Burkholderia cepacia TaxID=292 RepID=UPI000F59E251|nr:hypothetical protein [Burkholderia cepacia]
MVNVLGVKMAGKSGSLSSKYIPHFYVIVEDELAKAVIDCLCEDNQSFARKYILSGAWSNQASCLYGFFTYGLALIDIRIPSFGIIAVVDGDYSENEILKRINTFIKGDHKNDDQKKIIEMISDSVVSFHLEFEPSKISGLPEYNHKKWLEEITEEKIHQTHKEGGKEFLRGAREISSMLELVDFSKSISESHPSIFGKKGGLDYHGYYEIIKNNFRASNIDHKINNIIWYVLNCIKHYNKEKWRMYTSVVDEKIRKLYENHRIRFTESKFDFRT